MKFYLGFFWQKIKSTTYFEAKMGVESKMSRFPRVYFEGALYYILTKGEYNTNLFTEDSDLSQYLALVDEYKKQYKFKLYAIALILNQAHLLIEPALNTTISEIMHDINANYTKYYNKKYERKGHLFEERFNAILVEKETSLLEMTRYIHRLEGCKWNSYSSYAKIVFASGNIQIEIDSEEILKSFSQDIETGSKLYRDFVENVKKEDLENFNKKLYRTSIVGTKEFVEKIKKMYAAEKLPVAEHAPDAKFATAQNSKLGYMTAVLVSIILLFVGLNVYLLKSNQALKIEIKNISIAKETEPRKDLLLIARENLKKDFEEKYQADIVSYRAMAKRLEIEEKKARDL